MSTRTLIEIDHDRTGTIESDPATFVQVLLTHLRNPYSDIVKDDLRREFGVTVFGERHHASPYHIQWGHTHHFDYRGQDR